jgi:hypothetical protein
MQKFAKRAADGWIEPKQAAFCNNINNGLQSIGPSILLANANSPT